LEGVLIPNRAMFLKPPADDSLNVFSMALVLPTSTILASTLCLNALLYLYFVQVWTVGVCRQHSNIYASLIYEL